MTAKDDALAALAAHKTAIDRARQHLDDLTAGTVHLIADCRQPGPNKRPLATWQEIADTLGRYKSHVSAEYAPQLQEVRTVRVKPANPKEQP